MTDVLTYAARDDSGILKWVRRPGQSITSDGFVFGVTKPSATNTGVPSGQSLTTYAGPANITTPNQVFKNLIFPNQVGVQASNITFQNCRFEATGVTNMLSCTNAGITGVVLERCTFRPSSAYDSIMAIQGHSYTAIRCDISGIIDGFRVHNTANPNAPTNVKIWGNYVHDFAWFSPYSGHADNETHNDGIQIEGGTGTEMWGNYIASYGDPVYGNIADNSRSPYTLSCIIITPNVGVCNNTVIRANWFDGGYVPVNITEKSRGPITGLDIDDNRFSGLKHGAQDVLVPLTTKNANDFAANWTNNIREDTGLPVVFSNGG